MRKIVLVLLCLAGVASAGKKGPAKGPAPLGAGKESELTRQPAKDALAKWLAARVAEKQAAGMTATHRVDAVFECANCDSLQITERLQSDTVCTEGPLVVEMVFPNDDLTKAPDVTARELGADCCPGTPCPDRTPTGWMLTYRRLLEKKDLKGFKQLISPKGKLTIKLSWSDESGGGEKTHKFTRKNASKKIFTLVGPWNFLFEEFSCPEDFDDTGSVQCSAMGGGFGATYEWKRQGKNVYLVSVEESTH